MIYSRKRLPTNRKGIVHKAEIGDTDFYLLIGLYDDGSPGELFIKDEKGDIQGWCNVIGILVSLCLQAGVPLKIVCKHLSHQKFPPGGFTKNEDIRFANSVVDYVGRWMWIQFGEDKK